MAYYSKWGTFRPLEKKIPMNFRMEENHEFKVFGSKYFILTNKLQKLDSKPHEDIFLEYSTASKAYRV